MAKKVTNMTSTVAHKADDNKIQIVSLSDIEVDWNWNTRTPLRDANGLIVGQAGSNDLTGETDFSDLKASIAAVGQKDAVTVRIHPNPKAKKHYHLVAGYQRCEILRQLADEKGDKNPTVRVIIKNLDEKDARLENLRENTARSNLVAADLTNGIQKLLKIDPSLSPEIIATSLGKTKNYINKMTAIMRNLKDDADGTPLLERWKDAKIPVSVMDIEKISRLSTAAEQTSMFNALQGKKEARAEAGTAPVRGQHGWAGQAVIAAKKQGVALGISERKGGLIIKDPRNFFTTFASTFITYKTEPDQVKGNKPEDVVVAAQKHAGFVAEIAMAFKEGYRMGKSGEAEANEEKERQSREKEKSDRKIDKKNNADGFTTHSNAS